MTVLDCFLCFPYEVTVFPRSGVFLFEVCNNDSYVVRDVTWA